MKSISFKQSFFEFKLILLGLMIGFYSCDKEDLDGADDGSSYYVKYAIRGNDTYFHVRNWYVSTPDGFDGGDGIAVKNWIQTYGPVNKGFNSSLSVSDYAGGTPIVEIYVSKNNEPFTLKASRNGTSVSYKIE